MAEEVIYEWTHPNDLVFEAMGARFEGERPSRHKLWDVLADPRLVAKHRLRLLDANGTEVAFPLKLVSDTEIISAKE